MITFVIGGNKSGKSDYAMKLLEAEPGPALFLATGKAKDLSFRNQIASHRERRDPALPVVEVGWDLPLALLEAKKNYKAVLVDSLDFWLYVCTQEGRDPELCDALLDVLRHCPDFRIILVSCEIGFTPLPASHEARSFLKKLGRLNQAVAALSHEAYLVVAGLPLALKKAEHGRIQAD
ncbi:MAG: bifunctional adenosylcobinamide kinase/adenosylcobinamide-phosphate guanylyltransferase [Humidesulfovibrio sp.]|uniref:bifunctional adenosylcobinamide kinase/adenosylcobinamide-phosphate guanylyltransferase n=1 Tax=Humidesulfovibrio sp. TaxID=2910988 RepID=UPI0027346AC7|nr:bifunctional adenosylcobinamide kinase/adenosylcobinamide-phosphate guanylyltransferase [Humidesulfovibrio sp.]MDP2848970.1 bifunctional adenosylcobinamide kinase/adenosylcobinamide-phosphate guanylyltransferase [Humidesulfovibrio sp.]